MKKLYPQSQLAASVSPFLRRSEDQSVDHADQGVQGDEDDELLVQKFVHTPPPSPQQLQEPAQGGRGYSVLVDDGHLDLRDEMSLVVLSFGYVHLKRFGGGGGLCLNTMLVRFGFFFFFFFCFFFFFFVHLGRGRGYSILVNDGHLDLRLDCGGGGDVLSNSTLFLLVMCNKKGLVIFVS